VVELPRGPQDILALSQDEADGLLERLERTVPVHPAFVRLAPGPMREAVVLGDSHGDWRSTEAAVDLFRTEGAEAMLIGLGDYIDRPPDDCGDGSVANALYLLSLAARFPDRVLLVQGNHETVRRVPAYPHHLPEEVDQLWGPEVERYDRLMALLERGPIAASTGNGAYLAHAGFPRHLEREWTETYAHLDVDGLCEVVWAECDVARSRRGGGPPWGSADLDRFFRATGLSIFLRGHDPDLTGRPLYAGRCLTLHTTRIYEQFGGVVVGLLPLGTALNSVSEVRLRHLPTEGRSYPSV